MYKAFG